MVAKTQGVSPTLMFIRTDTNVVFGAYLTRPWRSEEHAFPHHYKSYWGTTDTFVFTLQPKFVRYPWVGHACATEDERKACPRQFMTGCSSSIAIGGGDAGFAIELDDDMHNGSSHISATFGNPPLHWAGGAAPGQKIPASFKCVSLELWNFAVDEVEM